MNNLSTYCEHIYGLINTPVYYYKNQVLLKQYPIIESNYSLITPFEKELLSSSKNVSYIFTKQFLCYGIVNQRGNNESIIIGPVSNIKFDTRILDEFMIELHIPYSNREELKALTDNFPIFSFDKFLKILVAINFAINQENISTEQLYLQCHQNFLHDISTLHTLQSFSAKEEFNLHNTFEFEQEYLSLIKDGDLIQLEQFLSKPFNFKSGIIAQDNLRQYKNIFISTSTLITRASIEGRLEIETAYQLSDAYIQQVEQLSSIDLIYKLQYEMALDFTRRVQESHLPNKVSPLINQCIQFISISINQPISGTDVADTVDRSRSFVSRKFKSEMGVNLNTYIKNRKLQEAKNLLLFTDKTITEISNYLCFSSQSYFQKVFKDYYKMTPLEYRTLHKK